MYKVKNLVAAFQKKMGTKRSKAPLSTAPPAASAAVAAAAPASGPKPKKGVTFRNNKRTVRGFGLDEVPENSMLATNYLHLINLTNARPGPRYTHPGNHRGRYKFTKYRPTNPNAFVGLTGKEAEVYAKAHRNTNTRNAFKTKLHKAATNGNITKNSYTKLLKKFDATYQVYGGKTMEEIKAMDLDEFTRFMENLNDQEAIELYELIDQWNTSGSEE